MPRSPVRAWPGAIFFSLSRLFLSFQTALAAHEAKNKLSYHTIEIEVHDIEWFYFDLWGHRTITSVSKYSSMNIVNARAAADLALPCARFFLFTLSLAASCGFR